MLKHIKRQKIKSTVGHRAHVPSFAVVLGYKMQETGNRAELGDATMLQITQVLIKKRLMGK